MNIVVTFLEAMGKPEAVQEGERKGEVLVSYLYAAPGTVVGKFEVSEQIAANEGNKGRYHIA